MTAVQTAPSAVLGNQVLTQLMQYTVEAYKTFEKLAESLPNPMTASMFQQFAADERGNRDLIEMKIAATEGRSVKTTLGGDQLFSDILEGEMSFRESAEFLISREKAMQRKLRDLVSAGTAADRNFLVYLEAVKRAHIVELERDLELIKGDSDWWKREDAEWRIVHGNPTT